VPSSPTSTRSTTPAVRTAIRRVTTVEPMSPDATVGAAWPYADGATARTEHRGPHDRKITRLPWTYE
jgi:hypothetical protein